MFITFEGIEGSGKTTQITLLEEWLKKQGKTVVVTKEPGGTALGRHIRNILLDPKTHIEHAMTEAYLFIADRLEHITHVILPEKKKGTIILCDRYSDSTYAYQCGGRQLPREKIDLLHQCVGVEPDLTFLLDLDVNEGLSRAKERADLDRFESQHHAFHSRVRDTYLEQYKQFSHRIQCIDCRGKTPDNIHKEIIHKISERISSCQSMSL